jgi:hypothetical protein
MPGGQHRHQKTTPAPPDQNKGLMVGRCWQDGKNFQAACIPFRFVTSPEVSPELHLVELALITISLPAWNQSCHRKCGNSLRAI